MMKLALLCLLLLTATFCEDEGARRAQDLRELSRKSSNHIIKFDAKMFNEYARKFPRPYILVLYFTSQNCKLCTELTPDYEYLANLYAKAGVTQQSKNPVIFGEIVFSTETKEIFKIFDFNTAPNLAILKPKFATLSDTALPNYLKGFIWSISYSDGHVTTHKMLDFVNKRTGIDVIYKPTLGMMLTTISVFLIVAALGVLVYTRLKFFWMKWQVWFAGVLLIYITCVSGVVYDILHGVPFVSRDDKGNAVIFSTGGSRYQNGAEGLVVSLIVASIGVMIILIPKVFSNMDKNRGRLVALGLVGGVYALVKFLEEVYRMKSWYNPMYSPPGDYISGWFLLDQGNNI